MSFYFNVHILICHFYFSIVVILFKIMDGSELNVIQVSIVPATLRLNLIM